MALARELGLAPGLDNQGTPSVRVAKYRLMARSSWPAPMIPCSAAAKGPVNEVANHSSSRTGERGASPPYKQREHGRREAVFTPRLHNLPPKAWNRDGSPADTFHRQTNQHCT